MDPSVAIFLPSLRGGGAQRVALQLANDLAQRNYAVDLVLATSVGAYFAEVDEQVHLLRLNCARSRSAVFKLARYLRECDPEVLLSGQPHATIVAWVAIRLAGWRGRFIARETNSIAAQRRARGLGEKAVSHLRRFAYRRADAVVAPSKGVAGELAEYSVRVIPNPLDLGLIAAKSREPLGELPSGRFVLAVGEFIPQKRFEDLVVAFSRLSPADDLFLVILGEGSGRQRLVNVAQDRGIGSRLILPGFDPNPFRYMSRCKVFVLSSAWEGLPNVLLQAIACGAPVVATDCPHGPSEILRGGTYGELVPVGDVDALAGAIERQLLRGEPVYPETLLAPYDHARVTDQWEQLLFPRGEAR